MSLSRCRKPHLYSVEMDPSEMLADDAGVIGVRDCTEAGGIELPRGEEELFSGENPC